MPAAGVNGACGEGVRGRGSPAVLWVGDEVPVLPVVRLIWLVPLV